MLQIGTKVPVEQRQAKQAGMTASNISISVVDVTNQL